VTERGLLDLPIRGIAEGYRRRDWSPVDVVSASLERMEATEAELHAWAIIDADGALDAARRAEDALHAGDDRSVLLGVPIGIKDIFDGAGLPTRCGSAARDDVPPARQSAVSAQALLDAGAVILGKTVTQEFAAGVVSAPARNPWDPDRIPGGSSGGSAAAIASGACRAAMGSDTGGSIRIPAAACGVVGFKPAFGQLDVAGCYPLSWTLDTIGPLARTVDDAWIMWQALLGQAAPPRVEAVTHDARIGIPRDFFFEWLQSDVRRVTEEAIEALRQRGVTIVETPWPLAAAARAAGFVINRIETAGVHDRVAVEQPERFQAYGPDLRLRIAAGRTLPATLYMQAQRVREVVRDSVARLFAEHRLDALLAPALPTTAVPAATLAVEGTGLDESLGAGWTRLTMPFNATGQPVLAVPIGLDRSRLPVGAQLASRPGDEVNLFRLGKTLEDAVAFPERSPVVSEIRK
jgi:aspartyl-tRNA(Asn)/glutamyl-tRNA(Gln) amidotransferase subunit A